MDGIKSEKLICKFTFATASNVYIYGLTNLFKYIKLKKENLED